MFSDVRTYQQDSIALREDASTIVFLSLCRHLSYDCRKNKSEAEWTTHTAKKIVCIPCVTGCDFNVIQRRPFSGFYITPGKNTDHAQEQRFLGKLPPRTGACPESKGVLTRIRLGGLFIPWGRRGHETIGIERFRLRIGAGIV